MVTARSSAMTISRTSNATDSTRLSLAAVEIMLENKSNILRRHSIKTAMLCVSMKLVESVESVESVELETLNTSCWGKKDRCVLRAGTVIAGVVVVVDEVDESFETFGAFAVVAVVGRVHCCAICV